jgi:hypothetical protein
MKLSIAIATLFLAATAALPASARTSTGHSFYAHGGVSLRTHNVGPAEARGWPGYRGGYAAYAAAPGMSRPAVSGGWGHCVSGSDGQLQSAYPSWDGC